MLCLNKVLLFPDVQFGRTVLKRDCNWLTRDDELAIMHGCIGGTDGEVYAPGVQVPLVSLGVERRRRAAVIPQPHVVQTHLRPSVVEHWRFHMHEGWFCLTNTHALVYNVMKLTEAVIQGLKSYRTRSTPAGLHLASPWQLCASDSRQQLRLSLSDRRSQYPLQRAQHLANRINPKLQNDNPPRSQQHRAVGEPPHLL